MLLQQYLPFTVLKLNVDYDMDKRIYAVATVLTVYGIETYFKEIWIIFILKLQQYLPFTVLKLNKILKFFIVKILLLQQYLPFTVLKPFHNQQ